MSKEITKEMLYNSFANKATAIQKRRIDEWARDPGNRELFYECLAQWESENLQYASDVDAALRRHQRCLQLNTPSANADSAGGKVAPGRPFLKIAIAASFLMTALMAGYLAREKILLKTVATGYGETKSVLLNDGTKVILNSNSTLTMPRFGFGEYTRE